MEHYSFVPKEPNQQKPRLNVNNTQFLQNLDGLVKLYNGELNDEDYTNAYCTLVTIRQLVDDHGADLGAIVAQLKGRAFSQSLDKSKNIVTTSNKADYKFGTYTELPADADTD